MAETVDVVVVGSGAGGSPVALELAAAGLKIVVLEKGRQIPDHELEHDEVRMNRRNFFVPYPADEPHTMRYGENRAAARTAEGWTSNIVGGGTVHFSGYLHRMKPVDLRLRSTLGEIEGANLVDWPISYDDLEPYYRRADEELGLSGRWKSHPFEEPRSADYPLPPLDEHPIAREIDRVGATLGLHPFPTPRGILSRPYRGRPACGYHSRCGKYGCPMGAKASTNASLLPRAVETGRCEVRPQAMATEVVTGADGRVSGVVYRDASGDLHRIEARCVVLACSAVETARLLLSSQSSRFPRGLANGSGQVGRNLVFSGLAIGFGIYRRTSRRWRAILDDRAPFVQRSIQDAYLLERPEDGVRKGGTLQLAWRHANPIEASENIAFGEDGAVWGKALKERLRREVAGVRALRFEAFCEYFSTPGTYVDLDPEVKDRWGAPVARMTIMPHPLSVRGCRHMARLGKRVLEALEPDRADISMDHGETKFLQGGTCRFGADPATSVLDPTCRAHEVDNLYVTDGSFLPTSGGVPNTLTIVANSFRVAEAIGRRFRSGEL